MDAREDFKRTVMSFNPTNSRTSRLCRWGQRRLSDGLSQNPPQERNFTSLRDRDKDSKLELSKSLFRFGIHVSASEAIRLSGRKAFIATWSPWRISSVGQVERGIAVEVFFKRTERERKWRWEASKSKSSGSSSFKSLVLYHWSKSSWNVHPHKISREGHPYDGASRKSLLRLTIAWRPQCSRSHNGSSRDRGIFLGWQYSSTSIASRPWESMVFKKSVWVVWASVTMSIVWYRTRCPSTLSFRDARETARRDGWSWWRWRMIGR